MSRKPVRKRDRFEVFKRDHFTCQYCGAQPPGVTLVIDHAEPVSLGGSDDSANLVTACEACNQGKSDKPLSHVPIRPDADLLYLEIQQELSELRRYSESRDLLTAARINALTMLQSHWTELTGLPRIIPRRSLLEMLIRYGPHETEMGLNALAPKVTGGYVDGMKAVQYLWGILRTRDKALEASA